MRIENAGWFGFRKEDIRGLNPRPLSDETISGIDVHFKNGHKAYFTEEFLLDLAELIQFERNRHETNND